MDRNYNIVDKTCQSRVWLTPETILVPLRQYFAPMGIELDPATESHNPTRALRFFTPEDDGLSQPWSGNVYLNPPYGREIRLWMEKLHREVEAGAHVVALLPTTRSETAYWQEHVLNKRLTAVCYVRKRIRFLRPSGKPAGSNPYGSLLVVYNGQAKRFDRCFAHLGKCNLWGWGVGVRGEP
jgi:hypothetical protein